MSAFVPEKTPTPHNSAKAGDYAKTILLPGDPLRAKYIAEHFLDGARLVNTTRNMFGYTGTYHGKPVSVMGTGMGCPSMGIYSYELINYYGVENLIRVGTAGAMTKDVHVRDLVFGMGASTTSRYPELYRLPGTYSCIASFDLLRRAAEAAEARKLPYRVGNILSSDMFYNPPMPSAGTDWASMGILAVEMESAALYSNAAYGGANALTILTISDSLVTGEATTAAERETSFTDMMLVALDVAENL